jgi:hypothetical protein
MRRSVVAVVFAMSAGVSISARVGEFQRPAAMSGELAVHEWGTFTTVAGPNGRAIDWLPLGGPSDLPCFVQHFDNDPYVKTLAVRPAGTSATAAVRVGTTTYDAARQQMAARVRMETPVLYFYSDRDTTLRVRVNFHHGLMTEWFPPAAVSQGAVGAATLRDPAATSVIEWPSVHVTPSAAPAFATERGESRYYAARTTDAAPLAVGGARERFLFYRGVADFDASISAAFESDGRILVKNLSPADIPAAILFERRGTKLGFRILGVLGGELLVTPPSLDGTLDGLRKTLEQTLVAQGLTPKEASAMVETWRDSWFEDGLRVFYIVPRRTVDEILPLEITPAPSRVARVFVGRMELFSSATVQAVRAAIDANDQTTLARYARFLGPITDRVLADAHHPEVMARIRDVTNSALTAYLRKTAICE